MGQCALTSMLLSITGVSREVWVLKPSLRTQFLHNFFQTIITDQRYTRTYKVLSVFLLLPFFGE